MISPIPWMALLADFGVTYFTRTSSTRHFGPSSIFLGSWLKCNVLGVPKSLPCFTRICPCELHNHAITSHTPLVSYLLPPFLPHFWLRSIAPYRSFYLIYLSVCQSQCLVYMSRTCFYCFEVEVGCRYCISRPLVADGAL